ncbi:hypothetical protein WJX84_010241 [Apatococcus fuscideae]|uniref:Uncharacterized protein n=1 Tax=Apatococcus fuscideae TaxID=2026836 RepID=A0AAW1SS01_9CHLO
MSGYLAVAHENSVSESTSPSQTGTLKHPEESPAAEGGHVITTHAHGQMDSEQRSRSLLGGQEQSLPQNQHDARPLQLDNASAERHEINGEITRPRMDFSEITPAPLPPHQPTRQTASFVSPAGRSCLSDDAGSQSSMPAAVDVPAVPLRGVQKGRSILDSARDQHRDGDSHAWNDEAARSPTSSDPATRSDTAARLISTPQQPRMVPCQTESTRYAAATSQAVLTSTPAPSMAMPAAVEHSAPASAASDASKARDSHQPDVLATLTPDELAALGMSQTIMEAAQPTFSASEPHEEPMQELSSRSGAQELEDRECGMVHSAFDDTFDPRGVQLTLAGNLDSQDMDRDEGWSSADSSVYEAARDISCAASLADSELEQPPHGQGMSALEALQNAGLNMTT